MAKRKALGRNLGALLGEMSGPKASAEVAVKESKEATASPVQTGDGLRYIAIEAIIPSPYQPRRDIKDEALKELADSIKAQGVIQPIVVRETTGKKFELIAGERRWRASTLAGLETIPALVRTMDDATAMALALIENIQREQLNPVEEAFALKRLVEECELTHQQVADAVGKSRTTVTNLLRVLSLEPSVLRYLEQGDLELGHAKALLALDNDSQAAMARQIANLGLSVRQTESLVRNRDEAGKISKAQSPDPDVQRLQKQLSHLLGLNVNIKHQATGKGKIQIGYKSLEQLEDLLQKLT